MKKEKIFDPDVDVEVVEIGILAGGWFCTLRLDDEDANWNACLPTRLRAGQEIPATQGWLEINREDFVSLFGDLTDEIPETATFWIRTA